MDLHAPCPLAAALAERLRDDREELTRRWLDRITARVTLDPNRIFPTDELLNHIPLLMVGIADYLENPAEEIAADVPVVAKAMELGQLRHAQGFDAYEILKEYEILGGVLFAHLARVVDAIEQPCSRSEVILCTHRVFHAVQLIQAVTTTHFLRLIGDRVREREERLRGFNRMVSHELKNRLGAIQGAHVLLTEEWLEEARRGRFLDMIGENAEGIRLLLENLVSLSRLDTDARQQRNILLPQAAAEAVRQLRGAARARGVAVRVAADLPRLEVNAAGVELCLSNYISNAIKYSDPAQPERWVEVRGRIERAEHGDCDLVVEVRDNGLGVPAEAHEKLFERFFRAHEATVTGVEGTGLGLSIVRETVETLGGRAWAEPREGGGSVFGFTLPCRREGEAAARADAPAAPQSPSPRPASPAGAPTGDTLRA